MIESFEAEQPSPNRGLRVERFVSPLCLLMALASLFAAFTLITRDAPDVSMNLHVARVEGDELSSKVLEADLEERRNWRVYLIFGLFISGAMFIAAAFSTLNPRRVDG